MYIIYIILYICILYCIILAPGRRFGQTGSGKTHTMSGLFERAAKHIFGTQATVTLTAFEIAGKVMRDLLDHSPKELKIREEPKKSSDPPKNQQEIVKRLMSEAVKTLLKPVNIS